MATKGAIDPKDKKPTDLPETKKVIDLGNVPTALETADGKSHEQAEKGVTLENKALQYPSVVVLPHPTGRSRNPAPEQDEASKNRAERKDRLRKLRAEFEAAENEEAFKAEDPKTIKSERVESQG